MKILVYRIGQLGDALASVPAVWLLRQNFPDARIDLLTNKPTAPEAVTTVDVFQGTGLFAATHLYPHFNNPLSSAIGTAALLARLRRERYDALAYLAPSARTRWQVRRDRLFFMTAGIKKFFGAWTMDVSDAQRRPLPLRKRESELLVERLVFSNLMRFPGPLRYDLGLTENEKKSAYDQHLAPLKSQEKILIAVCPFSRMPSKRWPLERYVTVLQELSRDYGCWPLLVGGKEDRQEGDEIIQRLGSGTNLTGALSVRGTTAIMGYCSLYLGNDTGAMHLAASAGIPCVAIFSARTSPGAWYPAGERNRILRLPVDCEGCELYRCDAERMRCITEIDEDTVLGLVLDLLGLRGSNECAV